MNTKLLQKYISGNATKAEKQHVTEWMQESPENMREYMAQRKLHDIAFWRTETVITGSKQLKKKFTLRTLWIETAKIAAIFAIILLGTHYWLEKNIPEQSESLQSIHVPAGQRAELMLADGTKVWLNSLSTLTFPGHFNGDIRNVKLDGEGYFAVSKNEEQPFIVETNKYNVKVLGTEFNVMSYTTDSIWEIALLEGVVEILSPITTRNGMKLEPNTMASLKGNKLIKGPIQEPDHFLWREGLICFNNVSVKDMLEKLELYYGVNIVVNNTKILNNRYTSKFRTRDGIEHVLKVLQLNNNFTYVKDDEKNVITIN